MEKSKMNILCASDENYLPYCGIMLTSVFENNKDVSITAYVMVDGPVGCRNISRFNSLAERYNQKIEFVKVDKSLFKDYPTKGAKYLTIGMYYRLCAERYLPEDADKVLYLDCDIIVTGSLRHLWNVDMSDVAVGCVCDYSYLDKKIYNRLGCPIESPYFNSGVLMMNLKYWREHNVYNKCVNYLHDNYDKLYANDQDILNALLYDKKIMLPITYNYQVMFLFNFYFDEYDSQMKQTILNVKNPIIIHYAMPTKPWNCMYYGLPYYEVWMSYKKKSPWKHLCSEFPKRKKINGLVKRYILWPLGIMYASSQKDFKQSGREKQWSDCRSASEAQE